MFLTTQVSSTRHDTAIEETRKLGPRLAWLRFRTESDPFSILSPWKFLTTRMVNDIDKLFDFLTFLTVTRWSVKRVYLLSALHPRYPFKICTGFAACSGSFTRSESRSIYSPLAWAARRSLSCCWPVVNSTQLTLTLNLAPVLCLCSDIPRNSQAIAQGIAPRVCPASGMPSIVWDFPAKR